MKVHLVNFSDIKYRASRLDQCRDSRRFGFDTVTTWSRDSFLRTAFAHQYASLTSAPRGSGYWLWKPFIIRERLLQVPIGDSVVYLDSGIQIMRNIFPLVHLSEQNGGFYLLKQVHINAVWTKRDCFVFLNCDSPEYHLGYMSDASVQVYQRNEQTISFVTQYLNSCCHLETVSDGPNILGLPNLTGFRDHRHDQSVLSLLAMHHHIPRAKILSQYRLYEDENDKYYHLDTIEQKLSLPDIYFHHHRKSGDYPDIREDNQWLLATTSEQLSVISA